MLRSAAAFGASCVALGPGSADPFSPKAVRASMGAIFDGRRSCTPTPRASCPASTIALDAGAERHARRRGGCAGARTAEVTLLVGAEREGLPGECSPAADHVARIPIATDSLNAAMAATVALYELTG